VIQTRGFPNLKPVLFCYFMIPETRVLNPKLGFFIYWKILCIQKFQMIWLGRMLFIHCFVIVVAFHRNSVFSKKIFKPSFDCHA